MMDNTWASVVYMIQVHRFISPHTEFQRVRSVLECRSETNSAKWPTNNETINNKTREEKKSHHIPLHYVRAHAPLRRMDGISFSKELALTTPEVD